MKAYLFLSVDIIGSTKIKYETESWMSLFKSFYESFPKHLDAYIDKQNKHFKKIQNKNRKPLDLPHPTVWKLIGDEILFYLELADYYEQVLFTVIALRAAIMDHNSQNHSYKIKGTIWFANIDGKHGNLKLTSRIQDLSLNDFLGSVFDIGFRLCSYSNSEKLIVSVETAILLIRDNYLTLQDNGIHIYFDGTTKLRGFESTMQDYPLIWIDLLSEDKSKLSKTKSPNKSSTAKEMKHIMREIQTSCLDKLMKYCQLYLESSNGKLVYPCIPRDRLFSC